MEAPIGNAERKRSKTVLKLCDQYFELAVSLLFQSPDRGYIFSAEDSEGAQCEHINIIKDGNVAQLYRPTVERENDASFPFWLDIVSVGVNIDTNLPELVKERFYLDHEGNFHRELIHNNKKLLMPVEDYQTVHLEGLLIDSEVAYVKQNATTQKAE